MSAKRLRFKRCVVVVNPVSSNYDKGQSLVRQLSDLFPKDKLEIIELREIDYERPNWLITRLNAALDADTLLTISGGDGTVNLVVDTLLRSDSISPSARRAVILPLWAGNASDLAHMSNGNAPASIDKLMHEAKIVEVYPLAVTTYHAGKTSIKLAIGYVSLGASAYASFRLNNPSHRRRRIYRLPGGRNVSDMMSIVRAFIGAPTFETSINGERRFIYDIAMINGPRIAKVSRIPVKLVDKQFHEILVIRKHPLMLSYAIQILRGITVEKRTLTERVLTVTDKTWAQIDGEALEIPGDTEITVKPFDRAFKILSTKL